MLRSHTCWEITIADDTSSVILGWWVRKIRDLWWLTFIDLWDRFGITQITIDPATAPKEILQIIHDIKMEYVLIVHWEVHARPLSMQNTAIKTWSIEIIPTSINIVSKSKELPFMLWEDPKTSEELRMKYRYLDLRRDSIRKNIEFRAKMNHFTRNRFTNKEFLEVQTPIFTVSSPEGARDFLVPSRINPWQFYALPQAPQQYKQLLMVWWIDKYFQIAPCFRDEDPRADRAMCEFYQIDFEMSFVQQEDVLTVLQSYHTDAVAHLVPHKRIVQNFPRINYFDALDMYWVDRPDLRFWYAIQDVTRIFWSTACTIFANAIHDWWCVRAIKRDRGIMTRKEIDWLTDFVKWHWAWWLAYIIYEQDGIKWPIVKSLNEEEKQWLVDMLDCKPWDMIFFGAWERFATSKVLWLLRLHLRDLYTLANQDDLAFCFVVNFPFYERDDHNACWDFWHNPFSMVIDWHQALDTLDPSQIMTQQYDLVLNGYELWSWSIRNHDPEILVKAFAKIWRDPEEVKKRFGAMYNAFQYWVPPHWWFAIWFDRLMMILIDETNIKSVYAFPKSGRAQDVMMWWPSAIDPKDLLDLHIQVLEKK